MPYDRDRHHRHSIRLKGYDYASQGMYFVTICTADRVCTLGEVVDGRMTLSSWGTVAEMCWSAIPDHFPNVTLDVFTVMPNHVHGIVIIHDRVGDPDAGAPPVSSPSPVGAQHAAPSSPAPPQETSPRQTTRRSLGAIVRSFKAAVTRGVNRDRGAPGAPLWQRNYWEHIIRDAHEYERIATYIISNSALWAEDRLYLPDEEVSHP